MANHAGEDGRALRRADRNNLIVRRVRIGLGMILAGMALFVVADHLLLGALPPWLYGINLIGVALLAAFYALLGHRAVRNRPVPVVFVGAVLVCGLRALTGVWQHELAPTAILCVSVALATGAAVPWGAWPQLGAALVAALAVTLNAWFVVGNIMEVPGHLVAAVLTGLAVSVMVAFELERHGEQLFDENMQRQRAEDALARLNAALEQSVVERTAQLEATTRRLEREAQERAQASHELRESEKRLQDILDNAPANIHLKDVEGRYLLVNRHWEQTFERSRAAVVGRTLYDIFPPAIADALRANDVTVLATRRPLQFEETLEHAGTAHTYLSVKFPMFDSDGMATGVCGISTDISERKAIEAERRRSEAALAAVVDNTTAAIWSIDREEHITVINAVARERFRQRFGVDLGTATRARVPPAVAGEFRALYQRVLAGEHVQVEHTFEQPDGPRQFFTSLYPIVADGVVTGATVFSEDITERKRVEEQVRAHQAELAHVLRLSTMGEMAAGLAHEINQPLGAIANYAQGSVRRLRAGSVEAAALLPIVEAIAREALRAGEIIRRLRNLVRKEVAEQEALDVNRLAREAAGFIETQAREDDITVALALDPALPPVTGNAIQIEQVLLNLLLNGVEAMRGVPGALRLVVTTSVSDDGAVEVAVRDSGVGLPESPDDVFEPFFTTKANGLGMGLSISRSIVEAHGGRLWATHNADRGSTFHFTLPGCHAAEQMESAPTLQPPLS